ncbi:hypothetical protein [Desulfobacula sp.]|uniref:hypothetical protein n=1 Tax=Desulfobacula sp. TaxID=2593537 RepID=UPI0026363167|nr:hypothetical protein [Desulfobacula sp.]
MKVSKRLLLVLIFLVSACFLTSTIGIQSGFAEVIAVMTDADIDELAAEIGATPESVIAAKQKRIDGGTDAQIAALLAEANPTHAARIAGFVTEKNPSAAVAIAYAVTVKVPTRAAAIADAVKAAAPANLAAEIQAAVDLAVIDKPLPLPPADPPPDTIPPSKV